MVGYKDQKNYVVDMVYNSVESFGICKYFFNYLVFYVVYKLK